jgi:phosphopantothenoylcysteine decarboxylase/phosphopantothenate--cysteine ligase
VLGVTGGIAAYKAIQLARDLTRLGSEVDVVLTESARQFVAPLSFEGVTGRTVLTHLFSVDGAALHLTLGKDADVICVAPATADFLARAAEGRADDLLCTALLATRAPVVICPAMNDRMYAHPRVQENVERLRSREGYVIAGPAEGPLAAGEGQGPGRMLEPSEIVEHVGRALGSEDAYRGRRVLVTAGPTREAIDPVRYVGNRSSGRMGFAVAEAAWRRGAEVTLVSGPSSLDPPVGVELVRVQSAQEMLEAVSSAIGDADVTVFAAAVADFKPTAPEDRKVKREAVGDAYDVTLAPNPDIAGDTKDRRKAGSVTVGFALETNDVLENARKKLEKKGFDFLVANDVTEEGAGFDVDTNRVTILAAGAEPEALPLMTKDAVAEQILDRAAQRMASRG